MILFARFFIMLLINLQKLFTNMKCVSVELYFNYCLQALMNKIDEHLLKVSSRLKALNLLNHIIRNEPTWTHHILTSRTFQSVLKCLQVKICQFISSIAFYFFIVELEVFCVSLSLQFFIQKNNTIFIFVSILINILISLSQPRKLVAVTQSSTNTFQHNPK